MVPILLRISPVSLRMWVMQKMYKGSPDVRFDKNSWDGHPLSPHSKLTVQGSSCYLVKSQIVNTLDLVVSDTTTQLHSSSVKAAVRQTETKMTQLHANEILLTKTGCSLDIVTVCRLFLGYSKASKPPLPCDKSGDLDLPCSLKGHSS